MEFALINRAIAEEAGRHGFAALHAVAKRYAGGQRQSAADDRIASIEPSAAVEEVHGPTASSAAALNLAEHFGHEQTGRNATGKRLAMFAVGGDHGVVRSQRLHGSHGHRFFAIV